MAVVLKFGRDGEFRRGRVGSLSWEEVLGAARAAFPELGAGGFDLRYRDDEGDPCLLSQATLPDFASLNAQA
eukprot:CAMPEP_0175755920 /NCGR_PEP_ID=MMETSP0097-20121207/63655_1 /TAXON_ID=311494 /ORGANISM="Alexandrium monilatum, Strain CCMP3105" /LENGTH=71 /DNA_ID=CAMNT_0017065003 /DNA_START=34 /DNA_END=246 /DNA_ORIENTATION=+